MRRPLADAPDGASHLLLSREQQQVSQLALTLAGGRLTIDELSRQGAQLASRGTLANCRWRRC